MMIPLQVYLQGPGPRDGVHKYVTCNRAGCKLLVHFGIPGSQVCNRTMRAQVSLLIQRQAGRDSRHKRSLFCLIVNFVAL